MKRNRNSLKYKVSHWFYTGGMKDVGNFVFDFITAAVMLLALIVLPHFFH